MGKNKYCHPRVVYTEKKGTSRTGKVDGRKGKEGGEVQRLWGMLYADDAGIVSR